MLHEPSVVLRLNLSKSEAMTALNSQHLVPLWRTKAIPPPNQQGTTEDALQENTNSLSTGACVFRVGNAEVLTSREPASYERLSKFEILAVVAGNLNETLKIMDRTSQGP